jgi:hypothetical protein
MAQDNSSKDKEMAARLKRIGDERHTGKCAICYKTISNGAGTYNHYSQHARGASTD